MVGIKMPGKHAKLSPSAAHRWMRCTPSLKAGEKEPDTDSLYALEGSAAHALIEQCMTPYSTFVDNIENFIGQYFHQHNDSDLFIENPGQGDIDVHGLIEIDKPMAEYVQEFIDYIDAIPGFRFVEIPLDMSEYVPECYGTADVLIIDLDNKTIHVVDFKYGKGVFVEVADNEQLKLYALGAVVYAEFTGYLTPESNEASEWQVITHLYQPRMDNITQHSYGIGELFIWSSEARQRGEMALAGEGEYNPGEKQCQFCPIKHKCKALAMHVHNICLDEFGKVDSPILTPQEYGDIYPNLKLIKSWVEVVQVYILNLLMTGNDVPGLKAVEGRSNRQWDDADKARAYLMSKSAIKKDDVIKEVFVSPNQAINLVKEKFKRGKNKVIRELNEDFIVKPTGKPAIALESDKKPAINFVVVDELIDYTQEN